ncbi:hypothetical protein Btru_071623 [Bulinus truncatus]|nr:hypothetical protein Btru_071623 [Bulinus truncatus]
MTEEKSIDCLAIPKRMRVFDKTLLPAGDVLPVWSNVSLDTKLPIPPSPRDCFILYTNKLGEPKYKSDQRFDFDLSNPKGREAPGPYDSLTDPSLKYYFNSPRTKQHLIESGLITDSGEIKCSIKDFNQYREFLRYRAVTELALQKKREKRIEEENINRVFSEWPKVHKICKTERLRMTRSEPPHSDWEIGGLEAYKEDLALKYRMREKAKLAQKHNRAGKKKKKKSLKKEKDNQGGVSEGEEEVSGDTNVEEDGGGKDKIDPGKEPTMRFQPTVHRGTTLIHELRQREEELRQRLEEQQRRRKEDMNKKIEESWHQRQQRQQMLLQQEADLEAKVREKRVHLIKDRERTLQEHRKKQDERLQRIRQELDENKRRTDKKKNTSNGGSLQQKNENKNNADEEDHTYNSDIN